MSYKNLLDFVNALEKKGELVRVTTPVSTFLEMTEIQTRLLAENGPAVLFENPIDNSDANFDIPVIINLFGTIERVANGMGRNLSELRELGETLAFLRQPEPPEGWKDALGMLPIAKTAMAMKPRTINTAPCQEIVLKGNEIDLTRFPIQTCWPNEPAPLITWPMVITRSPNSQNNDKFNLRIYRMQVTGKNTTLMRWLEHRGGSQHHLEQKKQKQGPLPAAVVIGADPGLILSAVSPIPETMSEYQFAGLLNNRKVELVNCKSVPLKVPTEAEIIFEGHVSLKDYEDEGPYGDHTGYYNSVEKFPVFTISTITMRKKPMYLSTFTGRPPDEPSIIGQAFNEIFIPLLIQQFPEIVDFWLPPEGCSYRVAVVSIKKSYPGQAKRIMMGVWSYLKQFLYTKIIIVVDEDIDTRNWKDVVWAISTRMDPVRDITLVDSTPIDYLDFASPNSGLGGKLGIDATNKIPPETDRQWGLKIQMDENIIQKVSNIWSELGLPGTGSPIWKR